MNAAPMEIDDYKLIAGCLLGGAIGDALGGPYEGRLPPFDVDLDHPLHISDDTQLTLATCEAICEFGRVDPASIAANFVRWYKGRRLRGLGASTLKALHELAAGQHWALAGAKGERSAGNGAAMRIAPLAFFCDPDLDEDRTLIRDVCRITHHNEEAYVAALAVLIAIRYSAFHRAKPMRNLPNTVASIIPDSVTRDRLSQYQNSMTIFETADQFGAGGYAPESVVLSLVAASLVETAGFEKILIELIQCGGDSDTTASIAGQIMGARIGLDRLPIEPRRRLPVESEILTVARSISPR